MLDPGSTTPPPRRRTLGRRITVTDRGIVTALIVLAAAWLTVQLWPVVVSTVVALVLVGTLNPLVRSLQARGLGRTFSVIIVFVALVGTFALIGLLTVPPLIAQARELLEGAPAMQKKLADHLAERHLTAPMARAVRGARLQELLIPSGRKAFEYSSEVVTVLGWGLTTIALAFYILADPTTTQAALYGVVPRRFHLRLARILLNLETIVGGYMRGQTITSLMMAVVVYALLSVLGISNPLPLAVFAAVTDVLPLIGGIVGAVPLVVAALPHGNAMVIIVIASIVVYQEIESRLIIPRVYGRVLRLPAWAITLALLAGAKLMGVLGALLSLPVAAGLRMILEELRVELPGDGAVDPRVRERDERVENLYAELAAGAGPGTSAGIALEIADSVRKSDAADPAEAAKVPITGGKTDR